MAFTSLVPSNVMLFLACVPVPPPGLKLYIFSPYPNVDGVQWVSPHCALRLVFPRGDGPGITISLPSIPLLLQVLMNLPFKLKPLFLVREIGEVHLSRILDMVAAPLPWKHQRES